MLNRQRKRSVKRKSSFIKTWQLWLLKTSYYTNFFKRTTVILSSITKIQMNTNIRVPTSVSIMT